MSKLPSFCCAIWPGQSRTTSSTLNPIASSCGLTGTAARYSHSMSRLVTNATAGPARRALARRHDVDLVDERGAVPAEPGGGRAAVPAILVEAAQGDLLVPHPVGQPERSRPDEVRRLDRLLGTLDDLLRQDGEERHRVGHGAEERALSL